MFSSLNLLVLSNLPVYLVLLLGHEYNVLGDMRAIILRNSLQDSFACAHVVDLDGCLLLTDKSYFSVTGPREP